MQSSSFWFVAAKLFFRSTVLFVCSTFWYDRRRPCSQREGKLVPMRVGQWHRKARKFVPRSRKSAHSPCLCQEFMMRKTREARGHYRTPLLLFYFRHLIFGVFAFAEQDFLRGFSLFPFFPYYRRFPRRPYIILMHFPPFIISAAIFAASAISQGNIFDDSSSDLTASSPFSFAFPGTPLFLKTRAMGLKLTIPTVMNICSMTTRIRTRWTLSPPSTFKTISSHWNHPVTSHRYRWTVFCACACAMKKTATAATTNALQTIEWFLWKSPTEMKFPTKSSTFWMKTWGIFSGLQSLHLLGKIRDVGTISPFTSAVWNWATRRD